MEISEQIKIVSGIVGGIGAILGIYFKYVKPYLEKIEKKKSHEYALIQGIYAELSYNGGSSMKDAILRLEESHDGLKKSHAMIHTRLDDIEETQKLSLNMQGTAYWISDDKGECTYASPTLCKIVGHNESEMLGNKWASWIVSSEKEKVFDAWNFSVEHNTVFDETYTYKKSDGSLQKVWALCFHKKTNGLYSGSLGKLEPIIDNN